MTTTNPDPSKPVHLEPSELGTKEYWDNLYTTEISNHAHDPSDKGTVWFDDSDAEAKVIDFLCDLAATTTEEDDGDDDDDDDDDFSSSSPTELLLPRLDFAMTSFLDLGTGNGSLLFGLRDQGWGGVMLGVDYSSRSVELAKAVGEERGTEAEEEEREEGEEGEEGRPPRSMEKVFFRQHDILAPLPSSVSQTGGEEEKEEEELTVLGPENKGWDVVLDKGTFDAISLSDQVDDQTGRRICEGYRDAVLPLVSSSLGEEEEEKGEGGGGGLFLITSCNWTEAELVKWFCGGDGSSSSAAAEAEAEGEYRFVEAGRVKYPSFSFGGVKGQTISSVCFRKVRK